MALKFQYNKTALQQLKKDLKIRKSALPTLQAKESALRLEVKKAKDEMRNADQRFQNSMESLLAIKRLWVEFSTDLLSIGGVDLDYKKIAGVETPILRNVHFIVARFSYVTTSPWLPAGIEKLKEAANLLIAIEVIRKKVEILEYARKKTTQKVNLYEKVQIPEYELALLKIKRFMEDAENLEKSAQKILKARLTHAEAAR